MIGRRATNWIMVTSGLIGLFVWIYDYDFFLNAGGPATPISSAILRTLHLQGMEYPVPLLVPPIVLVIGGIATGAAVVRLLRLASH
jgi:hypothetical protein